MLALSTRRKTHLNIYVLNSKPIIVMDLSVYESLVREGLVSITNLLRSP
jgi:hypothetical protein